MGSGKRRRNIKTVKGHGLAPTTDGTVTVSCDLRGTIEGVVEAGTALPTSGAVVTREGRVVVDDGRQPPTVLVDGPLTQQLADCLSRGHEYVAQVDRQGIKVVATVAPAP